MQQTGYTMEIQEFSMGDSTGLGTLYLPEGDGWYPALVLVLDPAGPFETEPYVAAALGQGYAVLTFEAADGALAPTTLAAADSLLMRPDIRPELIGLLGIGEGAWAAAFAGARAPETAFVVLLPGDSAPPPASLERLADLHCPVLAFVPDEAAAALLTQHLEHNPEVTIHTGPGSGTDFFAVLGPWLQRQTS
jgi:hypothetical protein